MNVFIDTPYLSVDEYARRTGQTKRAIQDECRAGRLPVKPRGNREKFMINNALLLKQALEQNW